MVRGRSTRLWNPPTARVRGVLGAHNRGRGWHNHHRVCDCAGAGWGKGPTKGPGNFYWVDGIVAIRWAGDEG